MGVRILEGVDYDGAVLYCATTMWAFGPVFVDTEEARRFVNWMREYRRDLRLVPERELEGHFSQFRTALPSQLHARGACDELECDFCERADEDTTAKDAAKDVA